MEREVSFAAYLIQLNKDIKFHEDWSFIFKIKNSIQILLKYDYIFSNAVAKHPDSWGFESRHLKKHTARSTLHHFTFNVFRKIYKKNIYFSNLCASSTAYFWLCRWNRTTKIDQQDRRGTKPQIFHITGKKEHSGLLKQKLWTHVEKHFSEVLIHLDNKMKWRHTYFTIFLSCMKKNIIFHNLTM